eukprot:m.242143 g.242143  ORF g.242143 m.242143 type:complete len:438 (-) comp25256_c0_seq1:49-1362(-)
MGRVVRGCLALLALLYAADFGLVLLDVPHDPLPSVLAQFQTTAAKFPSIYCSPRLMTLHGRRDVSAVVIDRKVNDAKTRVHASEETTFEGKHTAHQCAIFFHGFPDNAASFAPLLGALAAYTLNHSVTRFIFVALPGYEPASTGFQKEYLMTSIAAAMQQYPSQLDCVRTHIVGHDWGAIIAAAVATPTLSSNLTSSPCCHVEGLASTTLMAVPPRMLTGLLAHPQQILLSWYMLFFQLPLLPKLWLSGPGVSFLWRSWSPSDTPRADVVDSVEAQFSSWKVLSAAVSYYRHNVGCLLLVPVLLLAASIRLLSRGMDTGVLLLTLLGLALLIPLDELSSPLPLPSVLSPLFSGDAARNRLFFLDPPPLSGPVLILAGKEDGCIAAATVEAALAGPTAASLFPDGHRVSILPDCGHFLHMDAPALVAAELAAWWSNHE